MKTLYKNLDIIDCNGERYGHVLVEDNKIKRLYSKEPKGIKYDQVFDCKGLTLMPGFVDMHSHLRDPGLTYKEDIETGLSAAAKGGFTTVCAMANTKPVTDTYEKVKANLDKAEAVDKTRLIQVAAVTEDFGETLVDIDKISEITPLFSNDGQNINNPEIMIAALEKSKELPHILIATHNQPETKTIKRDLEILEEIGGRLHLCHISKKDTLDLIREAKDKGLLVTCEVTPHHLYASGLDYKVHPPFRSEEDRLDLIKGIKEDYIDACGTDHAPHSEEDKANGSPGINNYETALGMYLKVFQENNIPLTKLSEMLSFNPSQLLGIEGGIIEEDEPADFVIIDKNEIWQVDREDLISKSKNTPFDGVFLLGKVHKTVRDGKEIYNSHIYNI